MVNFDITIFWNVAQLNEGSTFNHIDRRGEERKGKKKNGCHLKDMDKIDLTLHCWQTCVHICARSFYDQTCGLSTGDNDANDHTNNDGDNDSNTRPTIHDHIGSLAYMPHEPKYLGIFSGVAVRLTSSTGDPEICSKKTGPQFLFFSKCPLTGGRISNSQILTLALVLSLCIISTLPFSCTTECKLNQTHCNLSRFTSPEKVFHYNWWAVPVQLDPLLCHLSMVRYFSVG